MGGNNGNKDMYFHKRIRFQPTPEKYLMALRMSPYRQHKKAAKVLQFELKALKAEHAAILKENDELSQIDTIDGSDDPGNN